MHEFRIVQRPTKKKKNYTKGNLIHFNIVDIIYILLHSPNNNSNLRNGDTQRPNIKEEGARCGGGGVDVISLKLDFDCEMCLHRNGDRLIYLGGYKQTTIPSSHRLRRRHRSKAFPLNVSTRCLYIIGRSVWL